MYIFSKRATSSKSLFYFVLFTLWFAHTCLIFLHGEEEKMDLLSAFKWDLIQSSLLLSLSVP